LQGRQSNEENRERRTPNPLSYTGLREDYNREELKEVKESRDMGI